MSQTDTEYPIIFPAGDSAYVVEFGQTVDPVLNEYVLHLDEKLRQKNIDGIMDIVPTYRSLLVQFNPLILPRQKLHDTLTTLVRAAQSTGTESPKRKWTVPVCYDDEFALDIDAVSTDLGLDKTTLINTHSAAQYRVYMIGFSPGYTYLGGLPETLVLPRKDTPRPRVEAGTIAIAGKQACVFSNPAPTGWHVLGRTPLQAFIPSRTPACLFAPGDIVKYQPIDRDTYDTLITQDASGIDITQQFLTHGDDT